MIRRPPRSTQSRSSAASDVYKRQRRNCLICPRPPNLPEGAGTASWVVEIGFRPLQYEERQKERAPSPCSWRPLPLFSRHRVASSRAEKGHDAALGRPDEAENRRLPAGCLRARGPQAPPYLPLSIGGLGLAEADVQGMARQTHEIRAPRQSC